MKSQLTQELTFGMYPAEKFADVYQQFIAADIAEAQTHLDDLPESQRRDLTLDTLRHFHCGYLKSWVLTKFRAQYACGTYTKDDGTPKKLPPPSERIIIPTPSMNHFHAVATKHARQSMKDKYWKQHQGTEELFCDSAALEADTLVVVEGEVDAMSIWQVTGGQVPVVAILGCGNAPKTLGARLSKDLRGKRFVIMLDADAAGQKSAKELCNGLIQGRVPAVTRYLYEHLNPELKKDPHARKIDANQILTEHGATRLLTTIQAALATANTDLDGIAAKIEQERAADAEAENAVAPFNPEYFAQKKSARADGKIEYSQGQAPAQYATADEGPDDARRIIRDAIQYIPLADASNVTRGDWFKVGCVMNRYGFDFADFDAWSKSDPARYEGTDACRIQWQSMTNADGTPKYGYKIGTLINIAKQFDYQPSSKKTAVSTDNTHGATADNNQPAQGNNEAADGKSKSAPEAPPRDPVDIALDKWQQFNGKIPPSMLPGIKDAVKFVRSLTAENITADIALDEDTKQNIAMCIVFGFDIDANKFFVALDTAKQIAADKIQTAAHLGTSPADIDPALLELKNLPVKSLHADIDKKVRILWKWHKEKLRELERILADNKHSEAVAARAAAVKQNQSRIDELRKAQPSPERDAELVNLIRNSCDWKLDTHGDRVAVKATAANADLIFTNDPVLDGLVGYDEFKQADVLLKSPPWCKSKRGDEWTDRDDDEAQLYLRRNYTEFADERLYRQSLTSYSHKHSFHVIREWLESLPKWDGVKRAETVFIKFLRVDDTPFAREVTLNALTAAVARVYNPGCIYQYCPILHGKQGIGKSYLLEKLGGKFYGVLSDSLDDSHALDTIRAGWIFELKELTATRKADVSSIKSFVDTAVDTRRAPFARRATTFKRQCVLFGTTNDDSFLSDATGNRRFPIVQCKSERGDFVDGLTDEYVAQIWAEVLQHYRELFAAGFDDAKLRLSKEAQNIVEGVAEQFIRDDGLETVILGYLDKPILPQIVWKLMTREERRKFIAESEIIFEAGTLEHRRRGLGGRQADIERGINELHRLTNSQRHDVVSFTDVSNRTFYKFFGSERRQHICAAEIFDECFGNDNRKRMPRIQEVLSRLEGWHVGDRLQKADPAYPNQKKPYWRDDNNQPADISDANADDNLQGEHVPPDKVPFDDDLPL